MQKPKSFRLWQPDQSTLLPPSPREWRAEDHQVYFLLDLVDELDLSQILIPAQSKDPRGEKGFDPRMLTLLLLYAYCVGIVSSRKIERACYEDLAFRVLTGNQQPDHSRISEFRRRNLDALKDLFVQILRLCQKAGMVSLGHVALDGTKVQANASKRKDMSHEQMLRAGKQLEMEIKALMRRAEILDAQDNKRYGKGKLGSDLPDSLSRRQGSLDLLRREALLHQLELIFHDRPSLWLHPSVLGEGLPAIQQQLTRLEERHGISLPLSTTVDDGSLTNLESLLVLPDWARERLLRHELRHARIGC